MEEETVADGLLPSPREVKSADVRNHSNITVIVEILSASHVTVFCTRPFYL